MSEISLKFLRYWLAASSPNSVLGHAVGAEPLQRRCHGLGGLLAEEHDENQPFRISVPPEIIHQAIWLYLRFTLSFRDDPGIIAAAQQPAATVTDAALGAIAWPALPHKVDPMNPAFRD